MADAAAAVGAIVSALVASPAQLDRIEALLLKVLAGQQALAGAAALAPVDLVAAAPVLGKSVATLRRLASAGKLPGAIRIGRSWRIDLGALRPATPETVAELAAEARRR